MAGAAGHLALPDTVSSRPWCLIRQPVGDEDLRGHQYLAVPFGVGEIIDVSPIITGDVGLEDVTGDYRADIDVSLGDRPQRLAKLVRVVRENELHVDLLGDPEERVH